MYQIDESFFFKTNKHSTSFDNGLDTAVLHEYRLSTLVVSNIQFTNQRQQVVEQ